MEEEDRGAAPAPDDVRRALRRSGAVAGIAGLPESIASAPAASINPLSGDSPLCEAVLGLNTPPASMSAPTEQRASYESHMRGSCCRLRLKWAMARSRRLVRLAVVCTEGEERRACVRWREGVRGV